MTEHPPGDASDNRLREFLAALRGETLSAVTPMSAVVAGAEPRVPVMVGAMGPQALRVSAELADGTTPFLLVGPNALGEHIVAATAGQAEHSRDGDRIKAFYKRDSVLSANDRTVRHIRRRRTL